MLLPIDPDSDGVLEYLGGVLNCDPGVGGAELGGRPSSFLCPGVNGMSVISSVLAKSGRTAQMMLMTGISCRVNHIQPP